MFYPIQLLLITFLALNASPSNECDIKEIYSRVEVDDGVIAVSGYGDFSDVEYLLVPTKLDAGKYLVEVSRKSNDLYEVIGEDIYIRTRYCYEYAIREEVVLVIESNYGYNKGKIIF